MGDDDATLIGDDDAASQFSSLKSPDNHDWVTFDEIDTRPQRSDALLQLCCCEAWSPAYSDPLLQVIGQHGPQGFGSGLSETAHMEAT